jgi:ketosteroid isomerase-like protein
MPASPSRTAAARPGGAAADLTAVWSAITGMYAAYPTGDRERIDSFLDPDATIWDSATPGLVCGKAELDQVRDGRSTEGGGPVEAGLTAYDQVIDVFGELAVARYWLRVDYRAAAPELVRNTAILRRGEGGWLIVHLHEEDSAVAGGAVEGEG